MVLEAAEFLIQRWDHLEADRSHRKIEPQTHVILIGAVIRRNARLLPP